MGCSFVWNEYICCCKEVSGTPFSAVECLAQNLGLAVGEGEIPIDCYKAINSPKFITACRRSAAFPAVVEEVISMGLLSCY